MDCYDSQDSCLQRSCLLVQTVSIFVFSAKYGERPYHGEHTGSRLIPEVKRHWAWLVLEWVTVWEFQVLFFSFWFFFFNFLIFLIFF